ncbi:MAG TPA: hypothetical protein VGO47_04240 [Chlamydiales bacterium]|nr:hypothetical protein [Chlamydiales bacterium]
MFFFDSGGAGPSAIAENTAILPENATAGDITLTVPSNVMPPTSINAVSAQPSSSLTSNRKKAAWVDPDDTNLQISLGSEKRLRKLRDTVEEDSIGGKDYEYKLRRQ